MQAQFAYERPAFLASTQRQQQLQQFTQLPAQQALQNLAQPLLPTSTGIVGANRKEQDRINADLKGANDLQGQLNTKYAEGQKVIPDTYKAEGVKEFGQAWGQAFQSGLDAVTATGKQIASLQSGIVNEQANYEVAQYNYQLFIAKRSLSDIGGLTGKNFGAGQSYLGVLEKQNLALSRQGQQLQFNLSQRQINFQTALAGFQAPGVTPEERQANVKEAQLEAGYAQKQLDIQKQMFGNQVQIVDIQNLRQGVDLSKQIGLLTRGRQVTIDVKVKTAELERAQALQQQQVAAAGTYLSQIDNIVNHDFAQMTALETAAGKAMFGAAKYAVGAFNQYLAGVIGSLSIVQPAGRRWRRIGTTSADAYGLGGAGGDRSPASAVGAPFIKRTARRWSALATSPERRVIEKRGDPPTRPPIQFLTAAVAAEMDHTDHSISGNIGAMSMKSTGDLRHVGFNRKVTARWAVKRSLKGARRVPGPRNQ